MERIEFGIKAIAAALAGLWGGLLPLVQLLLILMIIDIISGLVVAVQERKLSSDVAWRGMTKKAMILLLVAAAGAVESYAASLVGSVPLQATVAGFYAAAELISLVENAAKAGLPVPDALRQVLAKLSPDRPPEGQASNG